MAGTRLPSVSGGGNCEAARLAGSGFFGTWIVYHIRYKTETWLRILCMAAVLRSYDPRDFSVLFRLDQSCFPAGISYSKTTLRYFLSLRTADCLVAMQDVHVAGFILTEENPPLGCRIFASRRKRSQSCAARGPPHPAGNGNQQ